MRNVHVIVMRDTSDKPRLFGLYGKVFPWSFLSVRASKEQGLSKKRGLILSCTDRTNEVKKNLLYDFWLLTFRL